MKPIDIEQARAIARALAQRVQQEPAFAEQIRQDPTSILAAAGLPEEFVEEFLQQSQLAEVQGYLSPSCGLTFIL
jgi:hypothetical protein